MSTPIKPPGPSATGAPSPAEAADAARVEGSRVEDADGGLGAQVGEAREAAAAGPSGDVASAGGPSAASGLGSLEAELRAGQIGVDEAVDRLVQRALRGARSLPAADRAALEAQLRDALADDPTLVALRKDLERAQTA